MPNDLPRIDLREPAFRKFEHLIARACGETFTFHPLEYSTTMNTHTFAARLKDAIRGYKLYGYKSTLLPSKLPEIKITELDDGSLRLTNYKTMQDTLSMHNSFPIVKLMKQIQSGEVVLTKSVEVICPNYGYPQFKAMAEQYGIDIHSCVLDGKTYIKGRLDTTQPTLPTDPTTPTTFTDEELSTFTPTS